MTGNQFHYVLQQVTGLFRSKYYPVAQPWCSKPRPHYVMALAMDLFDFLQQLSVKNFCSSRY